MTVHTIRAPREDEATALAELHLNTWAQTYAAQFPATAWGEEARLTRIRMWSEICTNPRPGDYFSVAERAGELVGFAGAGAGDRNSVPKKRQLWFIYLLTSEQGSGAGQALLDEVLGDEPASLWVLEQNSRARAFYARNGFVADGTRQRSEYAGAGDEILLLR